MSVKNDNSIKLNSEVTEAYRRQLQVQKEVNDAKRSLEEKAHRDLRFNAALDKFRQTRFHINERGQKITDWDELDDAVKRALSSEVTAYNSEFKNAMLGTLGLFVDLQKVLHNMNVDMAMRYGHEAQEFFDGTVFPAIKNAIVSSLTPEGTISIPAITQEVRINDKNELDASLTEKNSDIARKFDESFERVVEDWLKLHRFTRGAESKTNKQFFHDDGTPLTNDILNGLKKHPTNGLEQYFSTQIDFDLEERPSKGP